MSLSTYAGLKTAIAGWLTRTDTDTYVADWITLAEARIGRELRVDQILARSASTLTAEFMAVPTNFLAPKSMRLTAGTKRLLQYLTTEQMAVWQSRLGLGAVQAYSRIGSQFWFYPAPTASDAVELIYYAAIPALSLTNATNWLLTSHPDAYLRATLLEAALFYEDNELVGTYSKLFSDSIGAISDAAKRDAFASNINPTASGQVV